MRDKKMFVALVVIPLNYQQSSIDQESFYGYVTLLVVAYFPRSFLEYNSAARHSGALQNFMNMATSLAAQ